MLYFYFVLVNRTARSYQHARTCVYQAFSINANAVFHIIFTLFSIRDQIDVRYKATTEL